MAKYEIGFWVSLYNAEGCELDNHFVPTEKDTLSFADFFGEVDWTLNDNDTIKTRKGVR